MADRSKPLKDLIETGVSPEVHLAFTLARVARDWPSLVGPALGSRTAPRRLEGRVLTVTAESPAAAAAGMVLSAPARSQFMVHMLV